MGFFKLTKCAVALPGEKIILLKLGTNFVDFHIYTLGRLRSFISCRFIGRNIYIFFLVLCSELCFGPSLEKVLLFDIALFALFYMNSLIFLINMVRFIGRWRL